MLQHTHSAQKRSPLQRRDYVLYRSMVQQPMSYASLRRFLIISLTYTQVRGQALLTAAAIVIVVHSHAGAFVDESEQISGERLYRQVQMMPCQQCTSAQPHAPPRGCSASGYCAQRCCKRALARGAR